MDVAYYQTGTADNDLRPVCPHANNHCTGTPNTLDAPRSALLLAKLLESGQVRIVGVDGKIGPILKKEIDDLEEHFGGWSGSAYWRQDCLTEKKLLLCF